jgi:hypothetical protein
MEFRTLSPKLPKPPLLSTLTICKYSSVELATARIMAFSSACAYEAALNMVKQSISEQRRIYLYHDLHKVYLSWIRFQLFRTGVGNIFRRDKPYNRNPEGLCFEWLICTY